MVDADGRTDGRRLDGYTISSPCEPNGSGKLKMVDDGRTDGHRLDGYTISSPCEPNGSGELIICIAQAPRL